MGNARRNAWIVAGAAALAGAFGIGHLVASRAASPGWYHRGVLVMSLITCALVFAAAVGVTFRRSWGFVVGVIASLVLASFGFCVIAGGTKVGIVYVVLGVVMLVALGKSIPAFRVATTPASSTG
jgi:hypothetical protein